MEEQRNESTRPVNPRRRKRSSMQVFKEAYLPVVIAGAAVLLILIFIIGAISRSIQVKKLEEQASIAVSSSIQAEYDRLSAEADALIAQANELEALYDIPGAIAVLESFSGNAAEFPEIGLRIEELNDAFSNMAAWSDPAQVTCLSMQVLIADPQRAFSNGTYGTSYNRNFITTGEFQKILEQLYANGYILVSLDDIFAIETAANGSEIYQAKTLFLPNGKKPLLLTQTQVNYYRYMVDSDDQDVLPDKDGAGFASKLIIDDSGEITCEMVDSTGATVTGAYDLVPILNAFIDENPDFSYRGAKAVIAVTGYDGLFGYRTNAEAADYEELDYQQEIANATRIANALRSDGYEIACYTYENLSYKEENEAKIEADLTGWNAEVLPILGEVDILVFARDGDISDATPYTGGKYNLLYNTGFRHYLGFCNSGYAFAYVADDYTRLGRILVTGSNLAHHADWFSGMFDAASVLDTSRGTIPS